MITNKLRACTVAAAAMCLLASCLSDDSGTSSSTVYDDTAITSFVLGTVRVNRKVSTDSTYTYTYAGSNCKVTIDHVGGRIYNADSLPAGSSMKMLASLGTRRSGTVTYCKYNLPASTDTTWTTYSASDSIFFSEPLRFRVRSSSGLYTKDYKVDIVAHTEYADSFQWYSPVTVTAFANADSLRGAATTDGIYVMASQAGNATLYGSTDSGNTWSPLGTYAADASVATLSDSLFVLSDGILSAFKGGNPVATMPASSLKTLFGACNGELYALNATRNIMVSTDRGESFTKDNMQAYTFNPGSTIYTDSLPTGNICYAVSAVKNDNDVKNITVAGTTQGQDSHAVVWKKTVDPDEAQQWYYVTTASYHNTYALPAATRVSATGYTNGWIMAINSNMDKIYCSEDGGITWFTRKGLTMPKELSGSTQAAAIIADTKGYFYIVSANGTVRRGKLNNATWSVKTTLYE